MTLDELWAELVRDTYSWQSDKQFDPDRQGWFKTDSGDSDRGPMWIGEHDLTTGVRNFAATPDQEAYLNRIGATGHMSLDRATRMNQRYGWGRTPNQVAEMGYGPGEFITHPMFGEIYKLSNWQPGQLVHDNNAYPNWNDGTGNFLDNFMDSGGLVKALMGGVVAGGLTGFGGALGGAEAATSLATPAVGTAQSLAPWAGTDWLTGAVGTGGMSTAPSALTPWLSGAGAAAGAAGAIDAIQPVEPTSVLDSPWGVNPQTGDNMSVFSDVLDNWDLFGDAGNPLQSQPFDVGFSDPYAGLNYSSADIEALINGTYSGAEQTAAQVAEQLGGSFNLTQQGGLLQQLADAGVPFDFLQKVGGLPANAQQQILKTIAGQLFGGEGGAATKAGGIDWKKLLLGGGGANDGGGLLGTSLALAPSLAAINYAKSMTGPDMTQLRSLMNQAPIDTSRLTDMYSKPPVDVSGLQAMIGQRTDTSKLNDIYSQFDPNALAREFDINTGLGRNQLTSDLSRRGVMGSSFGNADLANFNTSRDLGRQSLINQGLGQKAGIAGTLADIQSRDFTQQAGLQQGIANLQMQGTGQKMDLAKTIAGLQNQGLTTQASLAKIIADSEAAAQRNKTLLYGSALGALGGALSPKKSIFDLWGS